MAEVAFTRRGVLAAGAGAVGLGAVAASHRFASAAPHPRRLTAAAFVDSVGVQTHLSYNDTAYVNLPSVLEALRDLGIRHVRDDLRLGRPDLYSALNQLAAAGIGANLILGSPSDPPPAEFVAVLSQLSRVVSVEGTNEWDNPQNPSWPAQVYQRQQALYQAMRSGSGTRHIPVLAPAMAFLESVPQLAAAGSLRSVSDFANAHEYSNGRPVLPVLGAVHAVMSKYEPGEPLVISETGYHNAMHYRHGFKPISEQAAASYVPRLFLDNFRQGIRRTYLYEFLDQAADPGLTNPEAHFGLVRNDFSRKPAFLALRTLLRLAEDHGRTEDDQLRVGVRGPHDLSQLILAKSNGTHLVVLWRNVISYDVHRQRPLAVRAASVDLGFDRASRLSVYRPATSAKPASTQVGRRLRVAVAGDPVVVVVSHPGSRTADDYERPIST